MWPPELHPTTPLPARPHRIMHDEVSETENIRKNLAIERMIIEGCEILLDTSQTFVRQGGGGGTGSLQLLWLLLQPHDGEGGDRRVPRAGRELLWGPQGSGRVAAGSPGLGGSDCGEGWRAWPGCRVAARPGVVWILSSVPHSTCTVLRGQGHPGDGVSQGQSGHPGDGLGQRSGVNWRLWGQPGVSQKSTWRWDQSGIIQSGSGVNLKMRSARGQPEVNLQMSQPGVTLEMRSGVNLEMGQPGVSQRSVRGQPGLSPLPAGSLIQVPMSEKGKIPRGRLGSLSLRKEGERQCFLFSKHLIICTRGSGGKLHLTKVGGAWAGSCP